MGADELITPQDFTIIVLLIDDQPIIGEAVRRAAVRQTRTSSFTFAMIRPRRYPLRDEIKPSVILQDLVMPGVGWAHAGAPLLEPIR